MRIAFISYELPRESGGGGIGIYIDQVSRLLASAGHDVTVFCGALDCADESVREKVKICRIMAPHRTRFCEKVLPYFSAVHDSQPFDVIEGPDYFADAVHVKRKYPFLPMVVKLHTPSFLLGLDPDDNLKLHQKARIVLGALRRLRAPVLPRSDPIMALEKESVKIAELIAAPSWSIGELVASRLGISMERLRIFPLPYVPKAELLSIPLETRSNRVTFVGRLEIRKGVVELAQAIPKVLEAFPLTKFRLIGRDMPAPDGTDSMRNYLLKWLDGLQGSVEFLGHVENDRVLSALAETDICVFPSHYESFGLVCCEAMSAGRGVIGSTSGGMAEIINDGETGLLVPPCEPNRLASAVIALLQNSKSREKMGKAARKKILEDYSSEAVLASQVACYEEAIASKIR